MKYWYKKSQRLVCHLWVLYSYWFNWTTFIHHSAVQMSSRWALRRLLSASFPLSVPQHFPIATMAYVPAPSPTVVDQTTLMKKYLQFVAALTDANTRMLNLIVLLSKKCLKYLFEINIFNCKRIYLFFMKFNLKAIIFNPFSNNLLHSYIYKCLFR